MNFAGIFDRLRRPEGLWLVASNAIPVAGVLFFGWQALPLMVFYWVENVVIGAVNVLKIIGSGVTKPFPQPLVGAFLSAFFTLHYGLFCFVHGIFVFAIFTMADLMQRGTEPTGTSFDLLTRVGQVIAGDGDLAWSVVALVLIRVGAFLVLWVGGGGWREIEPIKQMFEPYGRIIVLHLTIFFASIPVIALGQPMIAVLILALLKTGLEFGLPLFKVAAPEKAA